MSIERLKKFLKNDELDPNYAVTWREEPVVGEI